MSTKTTFKRVALVTVAALGLGVMSVAPSSAAVQLDSIAVSAASTTQTAGETLTASSVVVTATLASINTETMTVTATIKSGPAYIAPVLVWKESTTALTTGTGTAEIKISGATTSVTQATAKYSLYLNAPTVAGTYVVKLTPSGHVNAVAQEVSIVVSAKTVGKSTAFIGTGVSSPATDTKTADSTVSVDAAASTTAIARIDVASIYGTTGTDTASAADAPAVVVTTDKGLVGATNAYVSATKSATLAAATDADPSFWVFANGDVGKATITVTIGTNAAITKTVTFKGAATALVATAALTNKTWTGIGAGKTHARDITATDSAGTAVNRPSGTLTVASSDTSVATAAFTTANETVTVTGVKAGTATITVSDPATTGKATAATFVVTVKANKPTTAPTITFDKTAYAVGEVVTMTVNADMADSATANVFTAALVTSAAVTVVAGTTALPTTGVHAIVGGKAEYKFYAPAVSGTFTVTGTGGADIDLTTLVTAPAVSTTVDIVNPGVDAATTAAEAAEAAAQDATDAALDATTAAEAAGALAQEAVDLVTELSAQVTKLMDALKAQIDSLTKMVMKMAITVAKVAAKK